MTTRQDVNRSARPIRYWMRQMSFWALHRILEAVAGYPHGVRAKDINRFMTESNLLHGRRPDAPPSPTTMYHYRTTMLQLGVLRREGHTIYANTADPDVQSLLRESTRPSMGRRLAESAKDHFASLVLRNAECMSLFFGMFLPNSPERTTVARFRKHGHAVRQELAYDRGSVRLALENVKTGQRQEDAPERSRRRSPPLIQAVPYGMRYWARDELDLIDEYCDRHDNSVLMFPLSRPDSRLTDADTISTANLILSLRGADEWTVYSIQDLIVACCASLRQPIALLYRAIDRLVDDWPGHVVAIPTSHSMATITATTSQQQEMRCRAYYRYRGSRGPFVSHIRVHRDVRPFASRGADPTLEPVSHTGAL